MLARNAGYAKDMMGRVVPATEMDMTGREILALAAKASDVPFELVVSGCRSADCYRAKQATIWVMRTRREPPPSYKTVARVLNQHHASTIHAMRQAVIKRESEPDFRRLTDQLLRKATEHE